MHAVEKCAGHSYCVCSWAVCNRLGLQRVGPVPQALPGEIQYPYHPLVLPKAITALDVARITVTPSGDFQLSEQ